MMDKAGGWVVAIRSWAVSLFVRAIASCSSEQERVEIISWLAVVREVLDEGSSTPTKVRKVYHLVDTKKMVSIVFNSAVEAFRNYREANLPLPIKIAMPIALAALAVVGGQGAGLAALGGATSIPLVLVIVLGAIGVTSVIEAFIKAPASRQYIAVVSYVIMHDELLRRARKDMRDAMSADVAAPTRKKLDDDEVKLKASLLAMDPFDFEKHVMSFFNEEGMFAWVTRKSNDFGIDGFAKHPKGLIAVQCKRNSESNPVGRPDVQKFRGAILEHPECVLALIVTTSRFTAEAQESAGKHDRIRLVDLNELLSWHREPPCFDLP